MLFSARTALVSLLLCLLSPLLARIGLMYALLLAGVVIGLGSPTRLAILAGQTALTLSLCALMLRRPKWRRVTLAAGITAHATLLLGFRAQGISGCAVLMHIGFLLDAGRHGKNAPFPVRAAALAYYPALPLGPIEDAHALAERIQRPERPSWERNAQAALRIATGLVKKLVVAERLSHFTEAAFLTPEAFGAPALFAAMAAYTVEIYMDFSGGLDVVLGFSATLGIELTEDFERPYLAGSFSEYWQRWHRSLGSWFRERLFYPLAAWKPLLSLTARLTQRARTPGGKRATAVLIPMLAVWALVGIWHGAATHYILWGLVNGAVLIKEAASPPVRKTPWRVLHTIFWMSFIRVLFRAPDLASAFRFYNGLLRFTPDGLSAAPKGADLAVVLIFTSGFLWSEIRRERGRCLAPSVPSLLLQAFFWIGVLVIWGQYGPGYEPSEFFYKRF